VSEKTKSNKDKKTENIEETSLNSCCQELKDTTEKLLRVNADFQNFKRRVETERADWIQMAQSGVLEKFLPIMDDLDRAITASEKEENEHENNAWLEGFKLIQKNLNKTFSDLGVKEIDCSSDFNPEFHEALMSVDSEDHKSGQIIQVLDKGYMLKDKVLRHAKVSVAK